MNNQYSSLPHTNDNIGGGVGTRGTFFNNGTNTNPNANPNNRNYGKKFNGKNKNPRSNYKTNTNTMNNNPNNPAPRQPFNNYNSFNPGKIRVLYSLNQLHVVSHKFFNLFNRLFWLLIAAYSSQQQL